MGDGSRYALILSFAILCLAGLSGCATMRSHTPNADLRPCTDGFAATDDGWMLGIKRYRPSCPDPGKLPVVLCHGLGLNGTFWTITDDHLPGQLADRGYEVFVVDMRGSGASHRVGPVGRVNRLVRETFLLELGGGRWTMDDQALHDVPAILNYVQTQTGCDRVNWVGHSLGAMLMFPYLELTPEPRRIANFVSMGAPAILTEAPDRDMLRANRQLRLMLRLVSSGRIARPMTLARPPGLDRIDSYYYTAENVDRRTVSRFYGYTLEDPGRGALAQLDPYLEHGRLLSADRRTDYASLLEMITEPTLVVAGEGDVLASLPSNERTFRALGSLDKTFLRFGKRDGHHADYGHCDLVWSRYAPLEIFPAIIAWLDRRQPGASVGPGSGPAVAQKGVDADLRPGLEPPPLAPHVVDGDKPRVGQPVLAR